MGEKMSGKSSLVASVGSHLSHERRKGRTVDPYVMENRSNQGEREVRRGCTRN